MRAAHEDFLVDDDKVLFVLTYMTGDAARTWKAEYEDANLANGNMVTWAEFHDALKGAFTDVNEQHWAAVELDAFKQQKGVTAHEYFAKFEQLARKAGYSTVKDPIHLIQLLKHNVYFRTIDSIFASGDVAASYMDLKKRIILIDRLWKEREDMRAQNGSTQQSSKPKTNGQGTLNGHQGGSVPWHRDGTGTVHGGKGQPMDVNRVDTQRRCFRCGQNGHQVRDCKVDVKNIRDMWGRDRYIPPRSDTRMRTFESPTTWARSLNAEDKKSLLEALQESSKVEEKEGF